MRIRWFNVFVLGLCAFACGMNVAEDRAFLAALTGAFAVANALFVGERVS